jgi:hypothetical protein
MFDFLFCMFCFLFCVFRIFVFLYVLFLLMYIVVSFQFAYIFTEQFKYLGTTLTNHNSIHAEIKSRLKSGNACYHSVQNLLSSSLLSKNVKIKIYRTIILPVVLYGSKTWSVTLTEKRRLWVFENKVLRRIFGLKRDEGSGKVYITRSFVLCIPHQLRFGWSDHEDWNNGQGM